MDSNVFHCYFDRFDIPVDKTEFFTSSERSLIVNYILRRASYRTSFERITQETSFTKIEDNSPITSDILLDRSEQSKNYKDLKLVSPLVNLGSPLFNEENSHKGLYFGIDRLLSDGVFDSAYSLHEVILILSENKNILKNIFDEL